MKAFIRAGCSTFRMSEVTEHEMDELMRRGGDSMEWPLRFSPETRRVWPHPPAGSVLVFYE